MNSKEEPDIQEKKIKQSLSLARWEAIPASIMTGLTEAYMIPYALALGAGAFEAGLLSSFRNLFLSIFQIKSDSAISFFQSRRALVLVTVLIQALLWIPLAFVKSIFGFYAVWALILLYTAGTTISALAGPAWGSIVSEYLYPSERGKFFGQRELMAGILATGAGLISGIILQFHSLGPIEGFTMICILAFFFRLASLSLLYPLHENPWQEPGDEKLAFRHFFSGFRKDNFVRYVWCIAAFNFSTYVASPYLSVYMLTSLHYDYITYSIVVQAGMMIGSFMIPRWGKIGDKYGNWVVLKWSLTGAGFLPFIWLFSKHPVWLLICFLLGGFLWGGLNLSMVNFIYDSAKPSVRTSYLAYFNVINGCCISLGTFFGGLLLYLIPDSKWVFFGLFLLSGILRCAISIVFRKLVKEVREVDHSDLRHVVHDLLGQRIVNVFGIRTREVKREKPNNHK